MQENIQKAIEGCRVDDRRSQELLYKSFYRAMVTICLRYTKNEEDAVELLNTGFLKVFKNIQWYDREKSTIYTWIRTIMVNTCIDFIRRRNKIIETLELKEAMDHYIAPEVITKIKGEEILEWTRRLPNVTGAVFNLYIIEGYSHKEIAVAFKITESTSRWHLNEARNQLKKMITKQNKLNG